MKVYSGCEGRVQACTGRFEDVLTREDAFWRSGRAESWKRYIHALIQLKFSAYDRLFSGWVLGVKRTQNTSFPLREPGK